MATYGKFQSTYNSNLFKKQVLLEALQVQFKHGTYPILQTSSSKVHITPHAYRLVEQTFGIKMATSEKFQLTNNSKPLKKTSSIIGLLTVKHIEMRNFYLQDCL